METLTFAMPDTSASKAVAAQIRSRLSDGDTLVFVSGNFNVLHPGHVRLLNFARETGAFLAVGINPDSAPDIAVPAELRLEAVQSISAVDHAFIISEDIETVLRSIMPDVVVKGREHANRNNPEQAVLDSYGGQMLFSSGDMRFSSLDLLERDYQATEASAVLLPEDYPERHGFELSSLIGLVEGFSALRVVVIGDLIVDDYVECDALGMSREDPTIVVTPIKTHRFVGGAGIVSAHAAGLGAAVGFFTVAGADEVADYAENKLADFGVDNRLYRDQSRPTTLKQRYRASGKSLLRVNHLRQHSIPLEILERMLADITERLPETDLLLFSDFNYGCLPSELVERLGEACGKNDVVMVADSQASSQLADISRFRDMKLITPTEIEARLALKERSAGLVVVGENLRKLSRAENVVITLGAEGLLVHAPKGGQFVTDRLPALNTAPKDVAGAGDSLFTCASLALCAGGDIWQASLLGSVAAACQVGRVGNTPLSSGEIKAEIERFI